MLKKFIVLFVIGLFIGITVTPCINGDSEAKILDNNKFVKAEDNKDCGCGDKSNAENDYPYLICKSLSLLYNLILIPFLISTGILLTIPDILFDLFYALQYLALIIYEAISINLGEFIFLIFNLINLLFTPFFYLILLLLTPIELFIAMILELAVFSLGCPTEWFPV